MNFNNEAHYQPHYENANLIGQHTLQSPDHSSPKCDSSDHATSVGSPAYKGLQNPPEIYQRHQEADIYSERFAQKSGVERFFNNKLVNQPSFSDRSYTDATLQRCQQQRREKRGRGQQKGRQSQITALERDLAGINSDSEVSRLNAFRDNTKEPYSSTNRNRKPSEISSSYVGTSAVPDDDNNSIYENTYKPTGRETQLYLDTNVQTEIATEDEYEVKNGTTVIYGLREAASAEALMLMQRKPSLKGLNLRLKPGISRDDDAFSFRKVSLRNEQKGYE